MTESIERRKNKTKGNDGAIGHVAYELGPLLEIRNGKLTMNVECLIVFAFPDGVGDFAFDDGVVEFAADVRDGQLGCVVTVGDFVIDVPLVNDVGRIGVGVARETDGIFFGDSVLFHRHRHFGCVFDFHEQRDAPRRSFGRVLSLAGDVFVVVVHFGRQFQDRFDVGPFPIGQHFLEDFHVVGDQVSFAVQPDNLCKEVGNC